MVHVVDASGVRIAVRGVQNSALAQLNGLLHGHIEPPVVIQDTIREGRTGADTEKIAVDASGVVIHVVQLRAGLVPTSDHRAHAQTVTAVLVHRIGQQLGSRGDRNSFLVSQLVQSALTTEVSLPELAIRRTTSHGAQQKGIDLDYFLHTLGSNIRSLGGTTIHRHNDAPLKSEAQSCCSFHELNFLVIILSLFGVKICPAKLSRIPHSRQHEVGRRAFRSHHIRAHLHVLAPFTTSNV
mmetsp:Transcript_52631/g.91857  ORF Transcript_52631/g.91857 Transcript_52631/m.91857 type:complete len:239 (+) Transcript_52631:181-897(+)